MRKRNAFFFQGSKESEEESVSDNQNQCSASGEDTEKAHCKKKKNVLATLQLCDSRHQEVIHV